MATLLEEMMFGLPESGIKVKIFTAKDVSDTLDGILSDEDLTRYIL